MLSTAKICIFASENIGQLHMFHGHSVSQIIFVIFFQFPSLIGDHNLKLEGVWRDLRCLSNVTSFAVREQSGHTLKSCLKVSIVSELSLLAEAFVFC